MWLWSSKLRGGGGDLLAQPAQAMVVIKTAMPDLHDFGLAQIKRWGGECEVEALRHWLGDAPGHGGDEVCFLKNGGGKQKMPDGDGDAARGLVAGEHFINIAGLAPGGNMEVGPGKVGFGGELAGEGRMAPPGGADGMFEQQGRGRDEARQVFGRADDDEINLVLLDHGDAIAAAGGADEEFDIRGQGLLTAGEFGHQHIGHVIGHADDEAAVGAGGVKLIGGGEDDVNLLQHAGHAGGDVLGEGGGAHAGGAADEKRVAKKRAQAVERMAESGLREIEAARGIGDAALAHDGVKNDEKVEIDRR